LVVAQKQFLSAGGGLKRFLPTNLGEAEDQRCQLFESEGRVLTSPGVRLRRIKKRFRQAKRDLGNSLSIGDFVKSIISLSQKTWECQGTMETPLFDIAFTICYFYKKYAG